MGTQNVFSAIGLSECSQKLGFTQVFTVGFLSHMYRITSIISPENLMGAASLLKITPQLEATKRLAVMNTCGDA